MLEFIGVVFIVLVVIGYINITTSDEVHISIKIDNKEIVKYDKEAAKDGEEKR